MATAGSRDGPRTVRCSACLQVPPGLMDGSFCSAGAPVGVANAFLANVAAARPVPVINSLVIGIEALARAMAFTASAVLRVLPVNNSPTDLGDDGSGRVVKLSSCLSTASAALNACSANHASRGAT